MEKITTEAVAPKILSVVAVPHLALVVVSVVVVIVVEVAKNNKVQYSYTRLLKKMSLDGVALIFV